MKPSGLHPHRRPEVAPQTDRLCPRYDNGLSLRSGFLKHRRQIAIVTDHDDRVDGRVTLADLLNTLPGTEIAAETDRVVDWRQAARTGRSRPSSDTDSAQNRRKQ